MEHHELKFLGKNYATQLPIMNSKEPDIIDYACTPEKYHADKTAVSSSGLRTILQSPRKFLTCHLGLDKDDEDDEKDHFRFGRALHMMLLEPRKFADSYIIQPDFGAMQSPKNREKKKDWLASLPKDTVVIKPDEKEMLEGMAESVLEHSVARNLFVNGKPEVSGWFTDQKTGIRCRVRPDYLSYDDNNNLHVVDLKSTRHSTKGLFAYDIGKFRYDIQLAFYSDGVAQILKREPLSTMIVAIQKTIPYEVFTFCMTDEDMDLGRKWKNYALATLQKCLTTGKWPGGQQQAEMINMPSYMHSMPLPDFKFN